MDRLPSRAVPSSGAWGPEWMPDWVVDLVRNARDAPDPPPVQLEELPSDDDDAGFVRAERTVLVRPKRNRTVNRRLNGLHLSMITVNAVLGTGLYWRGGQILELGGPLTVLLSFFFVGLLAVAVMQCITEMLCIWPVPGALPLYVSEFVDPDLGIAVGVAYWFTYSVSFAALIATAAAEFDFWIQPLKNTEGSKIPKVIDGLALYYALPVVLVGINLLPVEMYGNLEVIFATIKLIFYLVIVAALSAINAGTAGTIGKVGDMYWHNIGDYDHLAARNWFTSLLMSLSISAFAYVGVEVVAASALEARWPRQGDDNDEPAAGAAIAGPDAAAAPLVIGKTVKFSSIWISVLSMVIYVLGGGLAASDIPRDDCLLPRLSWINYDGVPCSGSSQDDQGQQGTTSSAFVVIAMRAGLPRLAHAFNAFLVFTALTCANVNLFVASRSLYGLTSRLDGGGFRAAVRELFRPGGGGAASDRRGLRAAVGDFFRFRGPPLARALIAALAWVGRTNWYRIPLRATLVSAFAFWWVPLLQLQPEGENGDTSTPIGKFIEILAQMGTVGVIIVWACECWAFIRFYRCIYRHRQLFKDEDIPLVRRWDKTANDYSFRSWGQPWTAWGGLIGCLFILVVCDGALAWNRFSALPFLSAYLIIFVFLALVVVLKVFRGTAFWRLVNLRDEALVLNKIKNLNDIRLGAR